MSTNVMANVTTNFLQCGLYKPVVCKEDNDPRTCKAVEVLTEVAARGAFVHF
jgi:hypothetical protein